LNSAFAGRKGDAYEILCDTCALLPRGRGLTRSHGPGQGSREALSRHGEENQGSESPADRLHLSDRRKDRERVSERRKDRERVPAPDQRRQGPTSRQRSLLSWRRGESELRADFRRQALQDDRGENRRGVEWHTLP